LKTYRLGIGLQASEIEAAVTVRPDEAAMILVDLLDNKDGDIVDAAHESIAMVNSLADADMLWDDGDEENERVLH